MAPHSSTLAWKNPMNRGAWWAAVHGVSKSRTQLSNFTFTFHFHALEKEMATHSSVLAWRIPGMGEPGGLPSMGSHRVRHDWSDLAVTTLSLEAGPLISRIISLPKIFVGLLFENCFQRFWFILSILTRVRLFKNEFSFWKQPENICSQILPHKR